MSEVNDPWRAAEAGEREREMLAEPDMSRMGDKHIKPCRGANCSELILWAKHVRTGKAAPLVKAKSDEKPNIGAWYDEKADQWLYAMTGSQELVGSPEYVNHFSNCNSRGQFKAAPPDENEQRQSEIK